MTGQVHAVAMDVIRNPRDGRAYVAIDLVLDVLCSVSSHLPEGGERRAVEKIAAAFRPASSYAEPGDTLDTDPDPATVEPYPCPTCREPVFRGRTIDDHLVVVDIEHDRNGPWIPASGPDGVARLIPWSQNLDGLDGAVRVHDHVCKAL